MCYLFMFGTSYSLVSITSCMILKWGGGGGVCIGTSLSKYGAPLTYYVLQLIKNNLFDHLILIYLWGSLWGVEVVVLTGGLNGKYLQ